ncbi:hypothetical protein [Cryobacterium melibiosiphilum]|uniref:hypothetical protein n=1 Tax=Cryobacterium melibiosiphilum TaxID=995039 RepID=UPI003616D865
MTRSYVMADIGDTVRPPESSFDRLGYGIFDCEDPAELLDAMSGLRGRVFLRLAPADGTP